MWSPFLGCLALLCCLQVSDGVGFAAMSIDLGSQFIKVGIVKPGVPLEIVLNKESRRKTPALVSIRNGDRLFGDAAQAVAARYPTSVYGHLLDLVGKNIDHPSVELFKKRFPHLTVTKHANDSSVVIPFGDDQYAVETLIAMILSNAKEFTEVYAEQPVSDVVITVPAYFTQVERLAIEKAAKIAGLNLLQLINDGTAVGINYGVFRRKEIAETPQRLLVYDMGASKTVATVLEYKLVKEKTGKEPKMTVLGVGYDRTLGGLEITLRLQKFLIEMFRHHYKTKKDITTNERGMAKMLKEAERVKQVLSANADTFAQIESVHEDIDMRLKVTREELNSLISDFDVRIKTPIDNALQMAELNLKDIDQIVMMGAGTRVPKVQQILQQAVDGKELGRFLNTDESAAMGALFMAAHLSKGFKVKPFIVEELVIFPTQVNFISKQKQEDGTVLEKPISRQVFSYKSTYPSKKKTVSFTSYTDDFSITLTNSELKHFSQSQLQEFSSLISSPVSISVSGLGKTIEEKVKPDETEFKGVKIGFQLDASGIIRTSKAEATIENKNKGVVESITNTLTGFFSSKKEEGEPTDAEEKKEDGSESKEQEGSTSESEKADEKQVESDGSGKSEDSKEKNEENKKDAGETQTNDDSSSENKKNVTDEKADSKAAKKIDVVVVPLKTNEDYGQLRTVSRAEIEEARSVLEAFERKEKLAAERAAAENELEAFSFEASLHLDEELFAQFSSEDERLKLTEEVKRVRAWLEDETSPETKTGEFKENLKILKDLVRPVKRRISESEGRPKALANLEAMLNNTFTLVKMGGDDEKSLFNKNDTDALAKKLTKLSEWLEEKKKAQAEKKDYETPAVTVRDLEGKTKALDSELKSFMRKMKTARTVNLTKDDLEKAMKDAEAKEAKEESTTTEEDVKKEESPEEATQGDGKEPEVSEKQEL